MKMKWKRGGYSDPEPKPETPEPREHWVEVVPSTRIFISEPIRIEYETPPPFKPETIEVRTVTPQGAVDAMFAAHKDLKGALAADISADALCTKLWNYRLSLPEKGGSVDMVVTALLKDDAEIMLEL